MNVPALTNLCIAFYRLGDTIAYLAPQSARDRCDPPNCPLLKVLESDYFKEGNFTHRQLAKDLFGAGAHTWNCLFCGKEEHE